MDILRYDSLNKIIICSVIFSIITMTACSSLSAGTVNALEILTDTYKLPSTIDPIEAKTVIDDLENALAGCKDKYLSYRIKYRIGVIYFKSHMLDTSKSKFLHIVNDPLCPELIRVSSLNMVAQISRLRGENKKALNSFQQLTNILEPHLLYKDESPANLEFTQLLYSSLFSRAEIFALEHNYVASIDEYNRVLLISDLHKNIMSIYTPMAKDRISNLYWRQREFEKYVTSAKALIKDYPDYYRTPIIRLELISLKFLEKVLVKSELPNDSFVAPALMIKYFKNSKDKVLAQNISGQLDQLSKEYENVSQGVLLQYHYAWLMDAIGEKEKAKEIFYKISSRNIENATNRYKDKIIADIVQEYAKIQYAILSGEKVDYKEALRVLDSLRSHPEESHISKLAKSVIESMQILRREVSTNENEE